MMDALHTLIGFFSAGRGHPPDSCTPPLMAPRRAWLMLCAGFGALFILIALCDGWLYLEATQGFATAPSAVVVAGPSADALNTLLAHYTALQAERQQLLGGSVVGASK